MNHANQRKRIARLLSGCIAAVVLAKSMYLGAAEPAKPPLGRELGAERQADEAASTGQSNSAPATNPLDAQRAYGYLQQICALGSRMSGSPGMQKQQALVQEHFEKLGGKVGYQRFLANNPLGGKKVPMANMVVEWHPERMERILLVVHYDTRPLPDRDLDPVKRASGVFLGANDGGSGVAVLMELAHLMKTIDGPVGVDFLLVDGEELVYKERRDPYFLGTTWFAQKYVKEPPEHKYRSGIVLDMVGEADLQIYQEQNNVAWRDTRMLVREVWATAARLGVREFIPRVGYHVQDDHFPLRNTAKIPMCEVIDFVDAAGLSPPAYWHTTNDTLQRCAGSSLAKVGWVVYEWVKGEQVAKPKAANNGDSAASTPSK